MAASALYACTKCTQRYPFEELSQGQQLCKVRGLWAAGGRGFLGRSPRELGVRCTAARLFSPAPSELGALASSAGTPLSEDVGIRWERPLRGRPNFALFQGVPGGGRAPTTFRGLRGGAE